MFSHRTWVELGALALALGLGAWLRNVGHRTEPAKGVPQLVAVAPQVATELSPDARSPDAAQRPRALPPLPPANLVAQRGDGAASEDLARRNGDVPRNIEAIDEFKRRVTERAEATASLVRAPRDLDRVLVEIDQDIARSRQVNAFHVKSGEAAIRAAYRELPEDELEARLLEFDNKLSELSAKYDPRAQEERPAGPTPQP